MSGGDMMEIEEVDPGVLDLCSRQLKDLTKIVLKDHLTEVDLTANRFTSIDPRVLALPKLENLSLRQNLVADATPLCGMANVAGFKRVVLHDNHLKALPPLDGFPALEVLDVGYNEVRSMAPVAGLDGKNLVELTLAANKIGKIEGVEHLTHLDMLELGSNRLRVIEGLETQTQLQELWLGRNKISEVGGLGTLANLRRISLQSNRLTSMRGLEACTLLEELYLSHNAISRLEGVAPLSRLQVLDVSSNKVAVIEDLEGHEALTDLWLNDNQIASFDNLEKELRGSREVLTTVYLHNNPAVAKLGGAEEYKVGCSPQPPNATARWEFDLAHERAVVMQWA